MRKLCVIFLPLLMSMQQDPDGLTIEEFIEYLKGNAHQNAHQSEDEWTLMQNLLNTLADLEHRDHYQKQFDRYTSVKNITTKAACLILIQTMFHRWSLGFLAQRNDTNIVAQLEEALTDLKKLFCLNKKPILQGLIIKTYSLMLDSIENSLEDTDIKTGLIEGVLVGLKASHKQNIFSLTHTTDAVNVFERAQFLKLSLVKY